MSDAAAAPPPDPSLDAWRIAWRQLRRDRLAMAGLVAILALFGVAVLAPFLANGRPLYLHGHLTHFYDNDVAAFRDWRRRLEESLQALDGGAVGEERAALLERVERYRVGLPRILARLGEALDPVRADALEEAARAYQEQLDRAGAPGSREELVRQGKALEEQFCRLSLFTCYERAAGPLLEVDPLSEALEDARGLAEPAAAEALARLSGQARALADAVEEGVALLGRFLPPSERVRLSDSTVRVLGALRGLGDPALTARTLRGVARELARELDRCAARPVEPDLQLLPRQTRWPVLAYLTPVEVGALVAYLGLLVALAGARWLHGPGPLKVVLALLAAALAAALAWAALVPAREPPAESLYKELARQARLHPDGQTILIFPPVPFGENENIYSDRETPPLLWELWELDDGAAGHEASLTRRLREPGEPPIPAEEARARLTRLRAHLLGTDGNGRDVLGRLITGSRVSLSVGFVAVAIYVAIGVLLGALAGYFSGALDAVISRFTEVVICFPAFFLIITVMSVFDRPSIFTIMIVIGLTRWTEVMRLVRGEFLRLSSQDFVVAARALGFGHTRVVFRHLLPNALGPVFVAAAFGVAGAILVESALSYLGFGVPQPQASWGSVLHDARGHEKAMWWVTVFPGLLIFVTITAYNVVGEGLRDALDPRLRRS